MIAAAPASARRSCRRFRSRCPRSRPVHRRRYSVPLPDGRALALGERTLVMAILNVTPDSFADGGRYRDAAHAIDVALAQVDAGADLIDVGGESTRPGATPVAAEDERARVLPVVAALARQASVPISIDTYKADVAAAALDAGATIVNDVSGLAGDAGMAAVVAARRAAFVLMHNRGRSDAMYARAQYGEVVREVGAE